MRFGLSLRVGLSLRADPCVCVHWLVRVVLSVRPTLEEPW